MRLYRPPFFVLLLIGFLFVSLPLVTAMVSSVRILDSLELQSVTAVYSSVDRVTRSRKIAELIHDEERKALLYDVLGDPAQLEGVNKIHIEINEALNYFNTFNNNEQLSRLVEDLQSRERYAVEVLNRGAGDPAEPEKGFGQAMVMYRHMGDLSGELVKLSHQLMNHEVEELQRRVKHEKQQLIWKTYGLIGFSVLCIILFLVLISRPVRQIYRGIERLGEGEFTIPVEVSGPRDLEALGLKLDWLRKRLAELDREKVKLIAHISHDLKTPLASIREGTGLLHDELLGTVNSRQKEVIGILDKNCTKLQVLIEKILDFNMARAQQVPMERNRIDLDELIAEVIEDHRNATAARHIMLDIRLTGTIVYGNRKQLRTVFDNLLSNAVKFSPDRGTVRIRLKTDGSNAVFLVEDSGPGIDDEDRGSIFSPFYRGKKSERAVVEGSGLGLAISKEYVEKHGGSIRALVNKPGARFMVTLPKRIPVEPARNGTNELPKN